MTGDAQAVAAFLSQCAGKLERELLIGEIANATEAFQAAIDWTSGPVSSAQLAAEGHPYSRRHGSPRRDPRRINIQTGALVHAWRRQGPTLGAEIKTVIDNTDPKAADLEAGLVNGRPIMFNRRPQDAVEEQIRVNVQKRRERALEEAFK